MAIGFNGLDHTFTISSVVKVVDIDLSLNIIKRREQMVYQNRLPLTSSNVAYISTADLEPNLNISVIDRSTSLQANRVSQRGPIFFDGNNFITKNEEMLITDVLVDAGQVEFTRGTPLFYRHIIDTEKLPRVDPDGHDFTISDVQLISVDLLDLGLEKIDTSEKHIDLTTGIIYSNIRSSFNSKEDFNLYFVQYSIAQGTEIITHVDLLSNSPVYRVATLEDLDETLHIKQDGRKVYLVEQLDESYKIILPSVGTYAYRALDESRIKILKPLSGDSEDPWPIRVSNGKFLTTINTVQRKYHIAEFLSQTFDPEPPYKVIVDEDSSVIDRTLIKLDHADVRPDAVISIQISNGDEGLVAFTTDEDLVGEEADNGVEYERWDTTNRRGIRSIDHSLGVVEIEGIKLKSSYTATTNYSYIEKYYEFSLLDFNPIHSPDVLKTKTSFFIDPDDIFGIKTQTLYYLVLDDSGKVISSNWDEFDNVTSKLDTGDLLYYESLPQFLATGADYIGEPHYISPDSYELFVPTYTTEGIGNFLNLGEVGVGDSLGIRQVDIIDSRHRGGGILSSRIDELKETYPDINWYWDEGYWDGIPYPGNASYMVEIPIETLAGAGGTFTPGQARDIIMRHTAGGVYPVAKAYGVRSVVSGLDVSANTITLKWSTPEFP